MSEPTPEADPVVPGQIIAGKYRVERVIGRGGMGVVLAAEHTTLRQKVAVKLLLPEAAQRGTSTERFLREARAAVAIKSEHVARVMDVGTLDDGLPFMVMELLGGADLSATLHERGRLPVTEAVDYILQACEAIAEAHALGIIHRDLKPANLFLTTRSDGTPLVKVLDFGLSKVTQPDSFEASLTKAGEIMGSPFYMSPEQIRSLKGLDARTDIWSLGVILYQLLAGKRPFEAEALAALFLMIGADPTPPLREHRADVPAELEAVILRCLEKDVKARPQSIAELSRLLAPFASPEMRTSVERIHRVLGDDTLSGHDGEPQRGSPNPSGRAPVASAPPGDDDDDNLATLAMPVSPAAGLNLAPPVGPPPAPLPANDKASSGSMAAVSAPVGAPPASAPAPSSTLAPAASGGRLGVVVGLAAALALGVAGVAAMRMRAPAVVPHPAASAVPAVTAPPIEVASAAPAVTAAPSASPSAMPSASAAAPSASAAAPSASAAAPPSKPPAQKKP